MDLKKIYLACPGRSIPYSFLQKKILSKKKSRFLGNYNNLYYSDQYFKARADYQAWSPKQQSIISTDDIDF